MNIEKVIILLITLFVGYVAYAENRNLTQDEKISNVDKLIMRQQTLMDMQIKYNEYMVERKVIEHSSKAFSGESEGFTYVSDKKTEIENDNSSINR